MHLKEDPQKDVRIALAQSEIHIRLQILQVPNRVNDLAEQGAVNFNLSLQVPLKVIGSRAPNQEQKRKGLTHHHPHIQQV